MSQVADAHPAAVDQVTFDRVQLILDGWLRPVHHPEIAAIPYLLSGLFICGYCGKVSSGMPIPPTRDPALHVLWQ
jgi:hypothetical protein